MNIEFLPPEKDSFNSFDCHDRAEYTKYVVDSGISLELVKPITFIDYDDISNPIVTVLEPSHRFTFEPTITKEAKFVLQEHSFHDTTSRL